MKTTLTIAAALLLSSSVSHAQPVAQLGPPPTFKIVTATDKVKGLITYRETIYKFIPVEKEVVEIRNGMAIKKKVTEYVTEAVTELHQIDAAKSRIIMPDGKQLPIDEVWNRVKANSVVVFSGNGEAPAQVYLRALNADAVVIIPPGPPAPKK